MRCRPGTVPVCGGPGSAAQHERTPRHGITMVAFRALVLHRIRDTHSLSRGRTEKLARYVSSRRPVPFHVAKYTSVRDGVMGRASCHEASGLRLSLAQDFPKKAQAVKLNEK